MSPGGQDFESWYRESHPKLVHSLVVITGDLDLASDAVDEACARAFARWARVRNMDSPIGWTFRTALNVLRRRHRRMATERRLLARERTEPVLPPTASAVWEVVQHLPLRQRTAVVLRYVSDLTQSEIATAMGITRGTVASTLADAHAHIADLIAIEPPDLEPTDA